MCISNVTKIKNIQNIQVMANQNKTDIGLIGLAVMGENLALNMADIWMEITRGMCRISYGSSNRQPPPLNEIGYGKRFGWLT